MLDDVQSALLLDLPRPAAGPLVLAVGDRPCAGPAADARVILIVQGVVRHPVLQYEPPHLALRPAQERIDLHQLELSIPLDDGCLATVLGLVLADGADPGVVSLHGPAQGDDLA